MSLTILNWTSGRKQSGRYLTPQLTAAKWALWAGTSQISQRSPLVSVKTPVLQVWEHSALFYPTCLNQRQRQISCSHLRSIISSLCFPLDLISTQSRNNMKSQCTHCSSNMSSKAELVQTEIPTILLPRWKTTSASFSPQFLLVPENKLLFTERLIPRNLQEQNQSNFFTPEWKYIPSTSLVFRRNVSLLIQIPKVSSVLCLP